MLYTSYNVVVKITNLQTTGAYRDIIIIVIGIPYIVEMCDIHEYEYYRDINDSDMI